MRAMILAAGLGLRMGTLTEKTPKSLLRVAEYYLIEYALFSLKQADINEVIINISNQGEQIKNALGNGKRYGMRIFYSEEKERLETGGGILQALPFFENQPFLVLSSDVITDYPLENLKKYPKKLAHLVLVDNPSYHPEGDFGLDFDEVKREKTPKLTFANIGLYHPQLFSNCKKGFFPLSQILFPAVANHLVTGEYYQGMWYNIGTPLDLQEINLRAREDSNLRPLVSETNTLSS